jgi:hypothetical protein
VLGLLHRSDSARNPDESALVEQQVLALACTQLQTSVRNDQWQAGSCNKLGTLGYLEQT